MAAGPAALEKIMKRSAKAISQAKLERFPNPNPERDYLIAITLPEFTCLCPLSGYPDFSVMRLRYVPDKWCVELKSLKLYINSYRDKSAFHEAVTNKILDDLVKLLKPRWMELVGDFNPRGNVKTIVRVWHGVKPEEIEE
jgi:7-cyano-7-deazaguanine reductase